MHCREQHTISCAYAFLLFFALVKFTDTQASTTNPENGRESDGLVHRIETTTESIEQKEYINASFAIPEKHQHGFRKKLVVHKNEGRVYVCTDNCIYQLSSNLDLEDETCAEWERKNQRDSCVVFVMDYGNDRLILCGGPDGFCNAYSANNVSKILHLGDERVVGNHPNITRAFIVPYFTPASSALHVAIINEINETEKVGVMKLHRVAIRNLQRDDYLTILGNVNLPDHQINATTFVGVIYGFSYANFGYFVTNDPNGAARITRIGRLNEVHSWNSQRMICIDNLSGTMFTEAYSAFIRDMPENNDSLYVMFTSRGSRKLWRICVYLMNRINHRITSDIDTKYRASWKVLKGGVVFSADDFFASLVSSDFYPFSFSVTTTNAHKTILIETINGTLMRMRILQHEAGSRYIYFSPPTTLHHANPLHAIRHHDSLLSDCMFFDNSKIYLYKLSKKTLIKLKISNCSEHKTADVCLSFDDSPCGWCSTSGKCCLSIECHKKNNSEAWISPEDVERYFTIPGLPTKVFPINMQHNITINVGKSFLCSNYTILCLFTLPSLNNLITHTTCTDNIINCTTPDPSTLVKYADIHTHFLRTQLFVALETFVRKYLIKDCILIRFFDCTTFYSCTSCLNSRYKCNWNLDKGRCTHETHVERGMLVHHTRNSLYCPAFYDYFPPQITVRNFLPAEENSNYVAKVSYYDPIVRFQASWPEGFSFTSLVCSFEAENRNIIVNATISHEITIDDLFHCRITCDAKNLTYDLNEPYTEVEISIGDKQRTLDNVHNRKVLVFKCSLMGDSCETCTNMYLKPLHRPKCVWCRDYDESSTNARCQHINTCSNYARSCEQLGNISFEPKTASWEGGTLVYLNIEVYRSWFSLDILKITVAGADCNGDFRKIGDNYSLSQIGIPTSIRSSCEIQRNSSFYSNIPGPVVLYLSHEILKSNSTFQFVDPKIEDFSPTVGQKCGGTEVTITGEHMNTGSHIQVFFDDLECVVLATYPDWLKCLTSPSSYKAKSNVIVKFDENNRTAEKLFEYDGDMEPDNAIRKVPRGTPAGGIDIAVSINSHTLSNQKVMMMVFATRKEEKINFTSECHIFSTTQMICPSPVFEDIARFYSLQENKPVQLDYEFVAENETQDLNVSKLYPKFLLYPNSVKPLLLGRKIPRLWIMENIILIATAASAIVMFVGIAIFILYKKKSRQMQRRLNKMGMEAIALSLCIKRVIIEKEIELDEDDYRILKLPNISIAPTSVPRTADDEEQKMEYELPQDDAWEFPRTNLSLGKCLGQGEFGIVVKGKAIGILGQSIVSTVAIKLLKSTHTDVDMICLVSEMEMMKLIGRPGHENVLRLLGCCTQGGPLLVITEYAPHGNLLKFLRKHELTTTNQLMPGQLNEKSLISFALQVAKGMEYLVSMRCIHRDLAARNVLVSDNNVMKIADFGLAKDVRGKYYYQQKKTARVPVRWMAPEAIHHGRNTTKSDVWSYGILLYEIMTLGSVPYSLYVETDKLLKAIKSGHRMEKPQHCSNEIYEVMYKCWKHQPIDRPTFTDIKVHLEEMLENDENIQRSTLGEVFID